MREIAFICHLKELPTREYLYDFLKQRATYSNGYGYGCEATKLLEEYVKDHTAKDLTELGWIYNKNLLDSEPTDVITYGILEYVRIPTEFIELVLECNKLQSLDWTAQLTVQWVHYVLDFYYRQSL